MIYFIKGGGGQDLFFMDQPVTGIRWCQHRAWVFSVEGGGGVNSDSLTESLLSQIHINPFNPEFTIVIFIHYKPRIAVAILDLQWMEMIWCGLKIKKNYHALVNQFHGNFRSESLGCRKIDYVFRNVKWCSNAS